MRVTKIPMIYPSQEGLKRLSIHKLVWTYHEGTRLTPNRILL